ncbi:MAG: adenylate/guanylate cyclase domain-containing protein [Pseudomonadota bacterium]|nr:adenylate/guanylate cyclase domain-containing protein [Pseudomonadota bacterium]
MGSVLFLSGFEAFGGSNVSPLAHIATETLIAISIFGGIEWGRRIGVGTEGGVARAANILFRISQGLVVIYWALGIGYTIIFPELATSDGAGLVARSGVEFAVFVPVLGSAMLLSAIAILLMHFARRVDPAEAMRLRALMLAAPFLLSGIVIQGTPMALLMATGLLIYLAASVRFLVIQQQRGQFMSRFVSPQLAHLARQTSALALQRRERRNITAVACDLRGFTAYARAEDSEQVIELLERYYSIIGAVAAAHGGTVKDHAGDGVLILVGAPVTMPKRELASAAMALEIRTRVSEMLTESGVPLGIGVGIASGEATVGAIHGAGRLEYVAVGNAVNLASRLCGRALDGEVLADADTVRALADRCIVIPHAAEPLKGYLEPVVVYAIQP